MDIVEVLRAIGGMDNEARKEAEAVFLAELDARPGDVVWGLFGVLDSRGEERVMVMAALVARRLLDRRARGGAWEALPAEGRGALRECAFGLWSGEVSARVHRAVTHLVAQLAERSAWAGGEDEEDFVLFSAWPELVDTVLERARGEESASRAEDALTLVGSLSESVGAGVWLEEARRLEEVCGLLRVRMGRASPARVRMGAVAAASQVVGSLEDEVDAGTEEGRWVRSQTQALLEPMFGALEQTLLADEAAGREALARLCDLARQSAWFFADAVHGVADAALSLAGHGDLMDETRAAALELVLALVEHGGANVRKRAAVVQGALEACLALGTRLEADGDVERWAAQDADPHTLSFEDEAESPLAMQGLDGVGRLAASLGGKLVLPRLAALLRALDPDDWAQARAGLLALGSVADGCADAILEGGQLEAVVLPQLRRLRDGGAVRAHPRAAYALCRAVALLGEKLRLPKGRRGTLQARAGPELVRLMLDVVQHAGAQGGPAWERVASMAALALALLLDHEACRAMDVGAALASQVAECVVRLAADAARNETQQNVLLALGSLVAVMGRDLADAAYDIVVQLARTCIGASADLAEARLDGSAARGAPGSARDERRRAVEDARALRNRAVECLAAVMASADPAKCRDDALDFLRLLLPYCDVERFDAADHDSYRFMQRAIANVGVALGEHFDAFRPQVIDALLHVASIKVGAFVISADGDAATADGTADLGFLDRPDADDGAEGDDGDGGRVTMHGHGDAKLVGKYVASGTVDELDELMAKAKSLSESYVVSMDAQQAVLKATAVHMLLVHAQSRSRGLVDLTPRICETVAPLCLDMSNAACRSAALCTLPQLVQVVLLHRADCAQHVFSVAVDALLTAVRTDRAPTLRATAAEALSEALRFAWKMPGQVRVPPGDALRSVLELCVSAVAEAAIRCVNAADDAAEDDTDERDEEIIRESLEMEHEVLSSMVDTIGYMIRAERVAYLDDMCAIVLPLMRDLIAKHKHPILQQTGLCTVVDLIEFCAPDAAGLLTEFFPDFLAGMQSPNALLRQTAAYGFGVAAQVCGPLLTDAMIAEGLPALIQTADIALDDPDLTGQDVATSENAAFALVKFARFRADHPAVRDRATDFVQLCLGKLPFRIDQVESRAVMQWLVEAIHAQDTLLLGEDFEHVNAVLDLLAGCIIDHHRQVRADPEEARFEPETLVAVPPALEALDNALPDHPVAAFLADSDPALANLLRDPSDPANAQPFLQDEEEDPDA